MRPRLSRALALLLAVLSLGTVGYHQLQGLGWLDALYMTVITVSTVGFGEIGDMGSAGRAFTMVVLAGGLAAGAYAATALTEHIVQRELHSFERTRRRSMERRIESLRSPIIVCGYGRIGKAACSHLPRTAEVVVIEGHETAAAEAELAGFAVVRGDARSDEVLRRAGIERACALLASLGSDADNVFLTITAKQINPRLRVISRAETYEVERTLSLAGADRTISPWEMGGQRMARAALRPAIGDVFDLAVGNGNVQLRLGEVEIPAGSVWAGSTLGDLPLSGSAGVIVVGVKRPSGAFVFRPDVSEVVESGNRLVVLAEGQALEELAAQVSASTRS